MKTESIEFISLLQKNTPNIRNICILAHVDHGKTTLADCLIASNGIISSRLAGKLRYMDSREDEQKRGITMKSSAISLFYHKDHQNYLINLIDSPGHIDFSSEVSTAVRLCDGALVVVDVVEGACPQTHAVLKQAWLEGIKPCLVLNKIDRLITELKLTPVEAYNHLQKVLEQVNAITGNLFSAQILQQSTADKDNATTEDLIDSSEKVFDWSSGLDEADDDNLYFSPAQGNVVFASAVDGWAFSVATFAKLYCEKLGISSRILLKTLWGDYFLHSKSKKIFKGAYAKGKKSMFVQFVLENIWNVYDAVLMNRNSEKIDKIVSSLNLKVSVRDSKHADSRVHLQAIFRQWLPLSNSLLDMVCQELPSPMAIDVERVKNLMSGGIRKFESFPQETQELKEAFLQCSSSDDAPVIVFVSKMLSVPGDVLLQSKKKPLTKEEIAERHELAKQRLAARLQQEENSDSDSNITRNDEILPKKDENLTENEPSDVFIAFARVFSGKVKKGSQLYVLGPKYDPANQAGDSLKESDQNKSDTGFGTGLQENHMSVCTIEDLYLMMGREFETFDEVPAGNILGINGLGDYVLKSATVSTSLFCPPFTPMPLEAKPIVRVAVEPKQPSQLSSLIRGMKLLNQADPCVQVLLTASGEYVIVAAGEVHLQRCLADLKQQYAKIDIQASDPIVPFRESVVAPPKIDMVNEEITEENKQTAHHTQRLPAFMLKEIQSYSDTIRKSGESNTIEGDQYIHEDGISKSDLSDIKKANKLIEKLGIIEANTSDNKYFFHLHAKPIPVDILECLEKHSNVLQILQKISVEPSSEEKKKLVENLHSATKTEIQELYEDLKNLSQSQGKLWRGFVDKMWAIGPKGVNNNLLINNIISYDRESIWSSVITANETVERKLRDYDNNIVTGFQLAVQAGPMCEEPLMGVAFFIEDWHKRSSETNTNESSVQAYGPASGQHISAVRQGCRRAMMAQPMRLMAAMYTCEIQATSEVLGKMYGVLAKREGKILSEDLKEGSDIFQINSELPVAESFGFAEEIRKKTSGLASPQLMFNRWQILNVDPFWIPTTEEEYELYGEKADAENQALKYVNMVRKRKGLYIEKKTVEFAEKQRTLKKNK